MSSYPVTNVHIGGQPPSGRKRHARLCRLFALAKAASLLSLAFHLWRNGRTATAHLSFEWEMLMLIIAGYSAPLIVLCAFIIAQSFCDQSEVQSP